MECIPHRAQTVVSTGSRIVITKAIERKIPNRLELRNEQGFSEWNPNIVYNKPSHLEVFQIEVFCLSDTFSVLLKALSKCSTFGLWRRENSFTSPARNCLTDIDGNLWPAPVSARETPISDVQSSVVDYVYTGAREARDGRERMWLLIEQGFRD
jgi:hypothetical protein